MQNKETVWRSPHGEIRIVECEDGRVEVNGSPVEPVAVTIENLRATAKTAGQETQAVDLDRTGGDS